MKKTLYITTLLAGISFAIMAKAADTSYDNCVAAVGASNCVQIGTSGTYYALSGETNNQTMTIYGTTGEGSTAASVPESAFYGIVNNNRQSLLDPNIKSLKTSGSVNIGREAFESATGLTSVDLSGVQSIGESAFNGATGLTSVDLTGVQSIENWAFAGTTGLTSANLTDVQTIGVGAFATATSLTSVDLTGVQKIRDFAFADATSLTSVDLTGVQEIGELAFDGATSLTSVDLTGVQTIGFSAFGATGLTSVVLPDSFFDESGNIKNTISDWALRSNRIQNIYCPEGASCQNYFKTCPEGSREDEGRCLDTYTWELVDPIPMTGINIASYKAENGKYVLADGTVIGTYQVPTPQNTTTRTELSDGSYRVVDSDGKVHYEGKRIYTVQEAAEVVNSSGANTFTFKLRYK